MNFEELDEKTREYMLKEFQAEESSGKPYRSKRLISKGLEVFPKLMDKAIKEGNEVTLAKDLNDPSYWKPSEESHSSKGTSFPRSIDPLVASETLALSEFSTWYTRGLSKKLLDEGVEYCEVYRADMAEEPRCECTKWEGLKIDVQKAYDGHRKRYHHMEIDRKAFSIPSGTNCHHSIRRVKD